MFARVTVGTFHPGTTDEALRLFMDGLLPSARQQVGFRGAIVLRTPGEEQGVILTLWESEEELRASRAPAKAAAAVERMGQFVAESQQIVAEVLLNTLAEG